MAGTYPVPTPALEVFGNCSSCVVTSGGTTAPSALANESWTMGTGYTTFPTAQQANSPYTYFFIRDPADTTNEICMVILGGGGTSAWSVIRGVSGSTVAHASGATWVQVISPYTLQNFKQAVGAPTTAITVANTATETVLANYTPLSTDLVAGVSWDVVAFGPLAKANGVPGVTFSLYWGGSGAPGSAFTSTGSVLLARLAMGTNAPALNTTMAAGGSFDVNGDVVLLSSTSATANLNLWYSGVLATTTANNATTTNSSSTSPYASSATAKTISGAGPIILTAAWSAASASNTITATAPLIYRAA